MFTAKHIIWLALCAAFTAGLYGLSIRRRLTLRQAGGIMTVICVLSEGSKILGNLVESPGGGMHLDPKSLPLHLCSLMLFVVFYLTFGTNEGRRARLANFLAVIGVLGSVCALLIPTNGTDFRTPDAYQCFVYHAGLLWFALYLIGSGQARLGSLRVLGQNLGTLLLLTAGMLYVNSALSGYDTNFFYLTRPPMEGLPVLNLDSGWYAYFFRLVALAAAAVTLFHLPFLLRARRKG